MNWSTDNVSILDPATNTVTSTISVGNNPRSKGLFIGPIFTLDIFPPSGTLATTFGFDVGFIVDAPGLAVIGGSATLNGVSLAGFFGSCVIPGTLTSGGTTFRCPDLTGNFLGEGTHTMNVTLNLSGGVSVSNSVTWKVVSNTEP